jgi:hypothetical protein
MLRLRMSRRFVEWTILTIAVALCGTHAVDARTHHRAPKAVGSVAATRPDAKISDETNRDPADVALDRKIKSICKGC